MGSILKLPEACLSVTASLSWEYFTVRTNGDSKKKPHFGTTGMTGVAMRIIDIGDVSSLIKMGIGVQLSGQVMHTKFK